MMYRLLVGKTRLAGMLGHHGRLTIMSVIPFCLPSLRAKSPNHRLAALLRETLASRRRSTALESPGSIFLDCRVCARPNKSRASTRKARGERLP